MLRNIEIVQGVLNLIEENLDKDLSLERISKEMNYSKYHLSRIFTSVVGLTLYSYVQRRRLSEAARALVFTKNSIMEIAMQAGYETQQSFTTGFKKQFKLSPQKYREKANFLPLQLKMEANMENEMKGNQIMDIRQWMKAVWYS